MLFQGCVFGAHKVNKFAIFIHPNLKIGKLALTFLYLYLYCIYYIYIFFTLIYLPLYHQLPNPHLLIAAGSQEDNEYNTLK